LIKDNNILIEELNKAYKLAESANKMGLSNFIQDRLDKHEKLGWMMKATSK